MNVTVFPFWVNVKSALGGLTKILEEDPPVLLPLLPGMIGYLSPSSVETATAGIRTTMHIASIMLQERNALFPRSIILSQPQSVNAGEDPQIFMCSFKKHCIHL